MQLPSTVAAIIVALGVAFPASAQSIAGSGSTFVYPIMTKWAEAYERVSGVHVSYEPIGSSGGITEIKAGAVDFGASDAPLTPDQLESNGLVQFPLVIGAIVPIVNLDGVTPGQLRFTGQLLADIYLGKIKTWNDPALKAINPDLNLPQRAITVVHRSDGSGTTFNWVDFLSKSSSEWRTKVGTNTSVAWPTGSGGNGNGGVATDVMRVKGAIGYVEFAYVLQKKLTYGLVQNSAGQFVEPTAASFRAATEGVDWERAKDFYVLLNNAPNAEAYPIVATSFVLIHRQPKSPKQTSQVLAFFRWSLENGQELASSLNYVPLPPPLVRAIQAYWEVKIQ